MMITDYITHRITPEPLKAIETTMSNVSANKKQSVHNIPRTVDQQYLNACVTDFFYRDKNPQKVQ